MVSWQLVSVPDSTEVVGRTTLVDTVPTGYGRPRGDAGTCPGDEIVTFRPAASWTGNVDVVQLSKEVGDGRRITTGAQRGV